MLICPPSPTTGSTSGSPDESVKPDTPAVISIDDVISPPALKVTLPEVLINASGIWPFAGSTEYKLIFLSALKVISRSPKNAGVAVPVW